MAEHNFQTQGPKAYYNSKGVPTWCHSKDDVARARQDGFTNPNYVRSEYPKTMFHKKTGATIVVGRLDWSNEQNEVAVKAKSADYSIDHVPEPEAKPAGIGDIAPLASQSSSNAQLAQIIEALESDRARGMATDAKLDALTSAVSDLVAARVASETRIEQLEQLLEGLTGTGHTESDAKAAE